MGDPILAVQLYRYISGVEVMEDIWTDIRRHWEESSKKERTERESWGTQGMKDIHKLTVELQNDGWRSAAYCPKDGSMFLAWCPTMAAPCMCNYQGEWPNGKWWIYVDGDTWPQNPGPVLWKPLPDTPAPEGE